MSGRKLGVEEEFHLIDAETRRLVTRAPELLEQLPGDVYVEELQRCVVEVNSGVFPDLAALRSDMTAAGSSSRPRPKCGVGWWPRGRYAVGARRDGRHRDAAVSADARRLSAPGREQLICGTQVHVDVADRDEAVRIANAVAPYLPIFLALSASSPFWADGTDTGYASMRSLVWSRWPTTGGGGRRCSPPRSTTS
ncbi:hypothetical protein GS939_26255 [Rhodococcus hoagii]|nr:hypothetical protein [Prescottella equi]